MIFDSHAHLDFSDFDHDRLALIAAMKAAGIGGAIIPGVSREHWSKQKAIAHQLQLPFTLGIHPWYCPQTLVDCDLSLAALKTELTTANDSLLVGIGECGLDKPKAELAQDNPAHVSWNRQYRVLEGQLALAETLNLPLILHSVKTHNELLGMLKQHSLPRGGVIHAFNGSYEIATAYLDLGFKLGIGGLLLNKNAKKLRDVVGKLPLDALLVETDSPSMTPSILSEKRNTPLTLVQIIAELANLQKNTNVLISEHLQQNLMQLFEL
ncbi:hydrolase TatD family protein [Shewanella carassii]|uniref:Hydrolase TatD family protein n=1 Tax=Shewanella carassii TaxID=1987584 RepID=A0ABQ1TC55_9GAMM|nr:hydrolase TatD family protein [Shewanella carassii]